MVAVEMGESFIKIIETASSKTGIEVVRLEKKTFSHESAAEEIKNILVSSGIFTRHVSLNIPRHLVTVRFVKLPSTDEIEINKMVKIESLKHIPYADEDMVSGYRIIEKRDDGYSNVLIAVAQADTVRKKVDLLKSAGLIVESVALGSETLLAWYMMASDPEDKSIALLVNISADHLDIDVISGGKLLFTRGVLFSAARPISTEKIIEQVTLSITVYRKESAKPVDKVVLAGAPANMEGLKTALAGSIKCPIEIIDQMRNMPVRDGARVAAGETSFVELLGLALRPGSTCIDLLPETAQEGRRLELVKKNMISALIVSGLIALVVFSVIIKKLHDKNVYISYVDSELAKIEPQVKKAKKMAKEIEIITSKIAERPLAIDIVTEVFNITPQGITLTLLEYESSKTVTLRGTALSLGEVFKYVMILEKSQYLENVKVKYANKRQGPSQESVDFEITCPVTRSDGGVKAKVKK